MSETQDAANVAVGTELDLGFRVYKLAGSPATPSQPARERASFQMPPARHTKHTHNSDLPYDTFHGIVVGLGREFGWLVDAVVDGHLHRHASPGGAPVTMVQPERGMLIFAYLFCGKRRIRKDEQPWLDGFQELSDRTVDWMLPLRKGDPMPMDGRRVRVYAWRPSDLGEIARVLKGIPADFSDWEDWGPGSPRTGARL